MAPSNRGSNLHKCTRLQISRNVWCGSNTLKIDCPGAHRSGSSEYKIVLYIYYIYIYYIYYIYIYCIKKKKRSILDRVFSLLTSVPPVDTHNFHENVCSCCSFCCCCCCCCCCGSNMIKTCRGFCHHVQPPEFLGGSVTIMGYPFGESQTWYNIYMYNYIYILYVDHQELVYIWSV